MDPYITRALALNGATLTLPWPPSANRLWRYVNGRAIKSAEYRAWLTDAYEAILLQSPRPKVKGPYRMKVVASPPDRRKRDLSNILKAAEDSLVHCAVVEDDSLAREIVLGWSDHAPAKPGSLCITVEAA